jgi:hypothetical protein
VTWKAVVERDLKDWSVPRDLALDRTAWKLAIHVRELYVTVLVLCSLLTLCCHRFLLGFISSLPQLAWDKRLHCLLLPSYQLMLMHY